MEVDDTGVPTGDPKDDSSFNPPSPTPSPTPPPNLPVTPNGLMEEHGTSSLGTLAPEPLALAPLTTTVQTAGSVGGGGGGDDSLEAKYAKLREVALRLKKSVVEKTQEIDRLQKENSKITSKSQNVSTIQQQFDKALDDVEKYKKLEASLQKDLQSSIKENIGLKEANFEYQAQLKGLLDSSKELTEKLTSNQTREDEVKQLKGRVEELETELKKLKEEQVDIKQEKRQRAMLSLEITDYEKKLADSNEKLLELQRELEVRQGIIEENDKLIAASDLKFREAERTIGDMGFKIEQFQIEVAQKSEKISFLQGELSKLNERFNENKAELGVLGKEYETAKLNFSSESSALVERCEKLTQSVSQHEYKISVLEEHKRSRESHISNLKLELVQLESEFSNYKLKAQSMLSTQKPNGNKSSVNDSDELENLQRIVQDFHSEISVHKTDTQTLRLENETLCMERAELGLKLTQLKTAALEREVLHDNEIQKLKEFNKQKESDFQLTLEQAKTENAAIIASYTVKLDTMKSVYENKVKSLENEILNLKVFNDSLQNEGSYKPNNNPSADQQIKPDLPKSIPPNLPLLIDTSSGGLGIDQLRMMPRGECEGSENNMSPITLLQTPSAICDMTFEQLLSTDMDNLSKDKYIGPFSQSSNTSTATAIQQSQGLREDLVRCRNQVKHLQNILRESESNCERLTQLSEALKQEIRRVERDSERKEHLKENTEYLKNIILKFVTLHGEDEKLRLIPVMRTILRLSPAETEQMETAVSGYSNLGHGHTPRDDTGSGGSSGGGGWSSYVPLPKWPSFGGGTGK